MTATEPKTTLACPFCRSDDIVRDATARWCPTLQQWELSGTQDTMTCQKCDAEFYEAAEVPVTEPAELARDDEGRTAQDRYTDDAIEQFGSVSIEDRFSFYGNDGQ